MFEGASAITLPFLTVALLMILVESFISYKKGLKLYHRQDTLCNLAIFVGNRLAQPFFVGYTYMCLKFVEQFALFDLPNNLATTAAAVVITDLVYYWEHRLSHTTKVLWFFHEVHHSSKLFNLTTSFRLHWLGRFTSPVMFAPLILLGFKSEQVVIFFMTNLIYQFFLHTKIIGKLGAVEGWINTPSAHRVHHGRNELYLDKNFGGILMIWDRLFGTYQAETEEPEYGILGKFESNNPFTVQLHKVSGYQKLAALCLVRSDVQSLR